MKRFIEILFPLFFLCIFFRRRGGRQPVLPPLLASAVRRPPADRRQIAGFHHGCSRRAVSATLPAVAAFCGSFSFVTELGSSRQAATQRLRQRMYPVSRTPSFINYSLLERNFSVFPDEPSNICSYYLNLNSTISITMSAHWITPFQYLIT